MELRVADPSARKKSRPPKDRCTAEGCLRARRGPRFCHRHSAKCGGCGGVLVRGSCCKRCTTSEWVAAICKWRHEARPVPEPPRLVISACCPDQRPVPVALSVASFGRIWLSVPQLSPTVDFSHADPASFCHITADFPGGRVCGPSGGAYKLRYRGAPAVALLVGVAGRIPCVHRNESAQLVVDAKGRYRDSVLVKRLLSLDLTRKNLGDLHSGSKV